MRTRATRVRVFAEAEHATSTAATRLTTHRHIFIIEFVPRLPFPLSRALAFGCREKSSY